MADSHNAGCFLNSQDPGPSPSPSPGPSPGSGAGPGQGDQYVPAETGLTVKFSTPPTIDSTNSTASIEPPPAHPQIQTQIQSRPSLNERTITESCLPPHHRQSLINIPVTPGIDNYHLESGRSSQASGSYFHFFPPNEGAASPDSLDDNIMSPSSPQGLADAAPISGHDILRRMSRSSRGRRESLSDIRAAYPSLPLTGNVISATFNMPHSLKYRKGADWVCHHPHSQSFLHDPLL